MNASDEALGDAPSGRRLTRYRWALWPALIIIVVLVSVQFRTRPNLRVSDRAALTMVLGEARADGMTFRTFVERRFAKQFCSGGSIGIADYGVSRMMGGDPTELILIDMEVRDPALRCDESVATIAAIKVGRAYGTGDKASAAIATEKWMDSSAQPEWLPAFRRGDDP